MPACEGLHVLKARLNLTSRSSWTCLAWISAGALTLWMMWLPREKPEGLLWESWFVLNNFLMSWASHSRHFDCDGTEVEDDGIDDDIASCVCVSWISQLQCQDQAPDVSGGFEKGFVQ